MKFAVVSLKCGDLYCNKCEFLFKSKEDGGPLCVNPLLATPLSIAWGETTLDIVRGNKKVKILRSEQCNKVFGFDDEVCVANSIPVEDCQEEVGN